MDGVRLRYLRAMQIPVWVARGAPVPDDSPTIRPGLHIGPGSGAILLVCADAQATATPLAADLARAVGGAPTWAWPDEGSQTGLPETVSERLLTGVAVLGQALAVQLLGAEAPATLGSARVVVLPGMQELKSDAQARRQCWSLLCQAGMAARP